MLIITSMKLEYFSIFPCSFIPPPNTHTHKPYPPLRLHHCSLCSGERSSVPNNVTKGMLAEDIFMPFPIILRSEQYLLSFSNSSIYFLFFNSNFSSDLFFHFLTRAISIFPCEWYIYMMLQFFTLTHPPWGLVVTRPISEPSGLQSVRSRQSLKSPLLPYGLKQ